MTSHQETRGPLVLYRSPECWRYAELEQTWKYKSTQDSISCHPYRSIRNKSDPVIKWSWSTQGHRLKKAPGHGHTITWYKFRQHFKACIIPIILYQFQKELFCLIILYDILFHFIHVYKAPGNNWMQAERSYHFDHWLHVSKNSSVLTNVICCKFKKNLFNLWLYTHLFMI